MRVWRYFVLCSIALWCGLRLYADDLSPRTPLNAAEQKVQRALEEELKNSAPTHRLWLTEDRAIEGILVSETETGLVIKQAFGPNNYISVPYQKLEILRVEALPPVAITLADVRLKMEFPALHFFKRPPYSVVTDESYFLVRHAMDHLERLHAQFRAAFPDWVQPSAPAPPIQIVFFGDQAAFRDYAVRNVPHLESASGFYSAEKNRLVLFNQSASADLQAFRQKVADLRRQWMKSYPNGIPLEVETQLHLLESRGIEYTYMVIRHEGAHQLLRSYGILTTRPPIPWLEEGLAAFCEMASLGQLNSYRVQDLKSLQAEHKLIPWRSLLDYREAKSFLGSDANWSKAAYAQSWLIVYSLMRNHKAGFMQFLHTLNRAPESKLSAPEAPSASLARAVGLSEPQLEDEWEALIQRITGD